MKKTTIKSAVVALLLFVVIASCVYLSKNSSPIAAQSSNEDIDTSEDLFEVQLRLAEKGNAIAQALVGDAYYKAQNYKEAFKWYLKSAQQGYANAQHNIGVMYDKGQGGVGQSYQEAFNWYLKAAQQGQASAQYSVGAMYHNGDFVEQNYQEALKWYLKAAQQGNAAGQSGAGLIYFLGHGVPIDYAESYKWYYLAAAGGDERYIGLLNGVATKMTEDQIATAKNLAVKWQRMYKPVDK